MALTKELTKIALARAFPVSKVNPGILVTQIDRQRRIQAKLHELKNGSPDIVWDTDHNSLQWRILAYLKEKKWIESPEELLKKAFESAKRADAAQSKLRFLGGNQTEQKLEEYRKPFLDDEQLICHQAAVDCKFSSPFTVNDFASLVIKAFRAEKGENLIRFLSALHIAREKRGKEAEQRAKQGKSTRTEKFNPRILVLSRSWVKPTMPLWLFRTRIISKVAESYLEVNDSITMQSINSAIETAKLFRLPDELANRFFSARLDAAGLALHTEIQDQTGVDVRECFRGPKVGNSTRK